MKWIYATFWIFIAIMLIWQFLTYNSHIDQKVAAAGPQQKHFFFNNKSKDTTAMNPAGTDRACVVQLDCRAEGGQPVKGSFTCHVMLKNIGNKKATGVIVQVSPYEGVTAGSAEDADRYARVSKPRLNAHPIPHISQWVSFPDILPGQTVTKDAVFLDDPVYGPGGNPNPQIKFETAP